MKVGDMVIIKRDDGLYKLVSKGEIKEVLDDKYIVTIVYDGCFLDCKLDKSSVCEL